MLDGDGALLMKLGSLATIGALAPRNYHHVVFDNGAHDSTGGQPTPSPAVDFALAALACGYRHAETVERAARASPKRFERQLALGRPDAAARRDQRRLAQGPRPARRSSRATATRASAPS